MRIDGGSDISGAVTATIVAAITLVMALVGLVAAAGFVVVAQRRQRQLGLLSAIGASARQLRLVMIMNGAIVGNGRGNRRCNARRHRLDRDPRRGSRAG